jgi:putative toxin-antitoxin system antitoxin component (TIGR02293 family)
VICSFVNLDGVKGVATQSLLGAMWHGLVDNVAESNYSVGDMRHILRGKKITLRQERIRPDRRYVSLGVSLGLRVTRIDALIEEIRSGLPFKALESFSLESGIAVPEIALLIELPERTLARRKVAGKLTSGESQRLLRLSNVFEKAVGLFEGNVDAAVRWLKGPKRALGEKSPWTYLQTEIGAREVEDLIGELEHGVFI